MCILFLIISPQIQPFLGLSHCNSELFQKLDTRIGEYTQLTVHLACTRLWIPPIALYKLSKVVHVSNLSTWETEAGDNSEVILSHMASLKSARIT